MEGQETVLRELLTGEGETTGGTGYRNQRRLGTELSLMPVIVLIWTGDGTVGTHHRTEGTGEKMMGVLFTGEDHLTFTGERHFPTLL
jgi:hypothetical protein